jgi:hypothetical protein
MTVGAVAFFAQTNLFCAKVMPKRYKVSFIVALL